MESLPRRQQEVLQATVRHYVDTVEPVGSKVLVQRFGLPASPATVRSAMGALELRGLLTQPHTSAGRIPSQLGYRHYVDQLLPSPGAAALQLEREITGIALQWSSLDDLVRNLARRLADLTGLLSLISLPRRPLEQLRAIRLVPCGERLLVFLVQGASLSSSLQLRLGEDWEPQLPVLERWANAQLRDDPTGGVAWDRLPRELIASGEPLRLALQAHARGHGHPAGVVAAGLGGLLAQPEFSHTSSLLPLVQLVETGPEALLGPQDAISDTVIWIGTEHPHAALDRCAVVQASYSSADGGQGQVAVVGPMRMAYATVRAAVRSVAGILQRLLA